MREGDLLEKGNGNLPRIFSLVSAKNVDTKVEHYMFTQSTHLKCLIGILGEVGL